MNSASNKELMKQNNGKAFNILERPPKSGLPPLMQRKNSKSKGLNI